LNPLGGDTLTILGTNFDPSSKHLNIVKFDDKTVCKVATVTSTAITCVTDPFVKNSLADLAKNKVVQVVVNSVINSNITVKCKAKQDGAESISPSSASPIAYTDLVILMKSGFTGTLDKTKTNVTLFKKEGGNTVYNKAMFVSRVIPSRYEYFGLK
jgi:hypothetical protein